MDSETENIIYMSDTLPNWQNYRHGCGAKYQVEQATQDKKSMVIAAQGEAEAALMIGAAMSKNPAFAELRRIETARKIAQVVARSPNRVYLNSDSLLVNLMSDFGATSFESSTPVKAPAAEL